MDLHYQKVLQQAVVKQGSFDPWMGEYLGNNPVDRAGDH